MADRKRVFVMGGSGVGMIASTIIERLADVELIGFLNDQVPRGTRIGKYKQVPVIGTSADALTLLRDDDVYAFFGFIGMTHEKEVYDKLLGLNIPREKYFNLIDPSCIIPEGYCAIGRGVLMAPLCQVSPDATIGDNCILLANSFVGHDSVLERFVSVANNASVGANVRVGVASHLGSNATIREKLTIGEYSVVGMGAVVTQNVPPFSIVVGNPARVIRTNA